MPVASVGGNSINATLDPVYGMAVDSATAKYRTEHDGITYFFCSTGCQAKFGTDSARYLHGPPRPKAGVIYTCPMHPQIRRDTPGLKRRCLCWRWALMQGCTILCRLLFRCGFSSP
jgi:YHS domain-containing protein